MSISLKLCIIYLILITWNKAGSRWLRFLILVFMGASISLIQVYKLFLKKTSFFSLVPIFLLLSFSFTAYYNPQYRALTIKDLNDLEYEKVLLESKYPRSVELLSNAINLSLDNSKKDPQTSLALLYHFKNLFMDNLYGKESTGYK